MSEQLKMFIEGYDATKDQALEYDESWAQIYAARQNNLILQSEVKGFETMLDKPCAIVCVGEVRGYIPLEVSGLDDTHEFKKLKGAPVAFKIIQYDREGETFIASRQAALEHMQNITWSRLEQDAVITAVVRGVGRKTIRVDIGGIQLSIPAEEMSYGWIDDLRELYQPGDHIKVRVTELDKQSLQVKISKKAVDSNPWPACTKRFHAGGEYLGEISGVAEYGIFVRLANGVDALAKHMRSKHPAKGDKVWVRVLRVDVKTERIFGRITSKG
jgi:ribosomal protein S1